MDSALEIIQRVPQPVQWAFAGIGALYVGYKVLSYVNFLLDCFVLGGTNVSLSSNPWYGIYLGD